MIARSAIIQEKGDPISVLKVYDVKFDALPDDKVLVEMLISPINPSDILKIQGIYPSSDETHDFVTSDRSCGGTFSKTNGIIAGSEGVGKVVQIGKNVTGVMNGSIEVGDWVISFASGVYGTWSTHAIANPGGLVVIKNKSGLTPEHLCSLKVNAATAYRMLKDIIPLNKGDYIIQNGANSGAGQYLIQLAHMWGYRTINVIRDRKGCDEVENFLRDLGADIVIKDSELLSPKVDQLLGSLDGPIKMIISCISGEHGSQLVKYLPNGGVHVSYGDMTSEHLSISPLEMVFRNISFRGFWLTHFYAENPVDVWMETLNDILDMMREGKLRKQSVELVPWYSTSKGEEHSLSLDELQSAVNNALQSSKKSAFAFTSKF